MSCHSSPGLDIPYMLSRVDSQKKQVVVVFCDKSMDDIKKMKFGDCIGKLGRVARNISRIKRWHCMNFCL